MKIEYKIVKADYMGDMTLIVEQNLQNDWKLQGGICVIKLDHFRNNYFQAMYKETEENVK